MFFTLTFSFILYFSPYRKPLSPLILSLTKDISVFSYPFPKYYFFILSDLKSNIFTTAPFLFFIVWASGGGAVKSDSVGTRFIIRDIYDKVPFGTPYPA